MNELADVDTGFLQSPGPSIRDHIESAVAVHAKTSPDIESKVSGAVEHRDRDIRARDRERNPGARQWEGEASDKRRAAIRDAFAQEKQKVAKEAVAPRAEQSPAGSVTLAPGAPSTWDSTAKAEWDQLSPATRLAIQRDHAGFAKHSQEIEAALAPSRDEFKKHGLSEGQAVSKLFEWERAFRNPQTRIQAVHSLMRQYGVTPEHLGAGPQQQYQSNPQEVAAAGQRLNQFAKGRSNFEQVRETMGLILERYPERYTQNGDVNLDKLHADACRAEGVTGRAPAQTPAASRPRPPAPRGRLDGDRSVRAALLSAARR